MISVTPAAVKHIQKSLTKRGKGLGIRIGVRTTGCSGMAYVLEYVDTAAETDTAVNQDGFAVYIDPKHSAYVADLTLDYVRKGLNEGFEFINPIEKDRCGCGESFRV